MGDQYLLCMTHLLGYGKWEEIKNEIRQSWKFRFDWFLKSRTPLEIQRRVDTLIRLVMKEYGDFKKDCEEHAKNITDQRKKLNQTRHKVVKDREVATSKAEELEETA